jgi:hypothetical protein
MDAPPARATLETSDPQGGTTMPAKTTPGCPGDWLEVHSPGGGAPRRGLILEILGAKGHEHYRVRWTDEHESIYYPADGAIVVPAGHDAVTGR